MLVSTAISLPVSVQRPIVISVARFANRKVKDSIATDYAASLIGDLTSAPWATYAFMRIADSASVVRHLPALLRDMNDPSPEVRMWTATILGNIADTATAKNMSPLPAIPCSNRGQKNTRRIPWLPHQSGRWTNRLVIRGNEGERLQCC